MHDGIISFGIAMAVLFVFLFIGACVDAYFKDQEILIRNQERKRAAEARMLAAEARKQEREHAASLARAQKEYRAYANKCEKISQSISRLMEVPALTSYLSSAESITKKFFDLPSPYDASTAVIHKKLQADVSRLYKETLVQYLRVSFERMMNSALEPMSPDQFRRRINAYFASVDKHRSIFDSNVLGEVEILRNQSRVR